MTALEKYARLEAEGTWRPGPDAPRREVIVSFGEATLVLSDPSSSMPLAHWSLPAVTRANPGSRPARYSPGGDPAEDLEIIDDLMIAAIDKVNQAVDARRPNVGRLGGGLLAAALLVAVAAGALWVPGALIDHAARVAPAAQKDELGAAVLADIVRVTGPVCTTNGGAAALSALHERLLPPDAQPKTRTAPDAIVVMPAPLGRALALPGDRIVVGTDLLSPEARTRFDDNDPQGVPSPAGAATPAPSRAAEALAGHILAAQIRAQADDPVLDVLRYAGWQASFSLLTRGRLPDGALDGYADRLIGTPSSTPDPELLLKRFQVAGISSQPYARALDPTGETTLPLIEADPFRTTLPAPVLAADQWQALSAICSAPQQASPPI